MNRRNFILQSSLASGYFMLPGFLKPLEKLSGSDNVKKLVVIQLSGGNDWLNTVVPYKNDIYYKSRPKLALKENMLVPLEKDLALNRSMITLKDFYDTGEMAIVNNVGYPNPDRSHFRSMDIWQSASSANEYLYTGWLGRYLDASCKNYYEGIELDDTLSLALKGKNLNGLAAKNFERLVKENKQPFFNQVTEIAKNAPLSEDNQGYLYKMLINSHSSIDYLAEKNKIAENAADYPETQLGKQLKQVAGLIQSDVGTRVYYVSLSGFDTHAGQLNRQNNLLTVYSEALTSFIKNLKDTGKWDDTLVFTFSEFGRRVEENASQGTDHGTAGNVLLFGKNLKKKGIVNEAPNLENLDEGDVKYSVDFRSIYKNILQGWLGADANKIISAGVNKFEVV